MATIGNPLSGSNTRALHRIHRGIRVPSFPEAGTLNSIRARISQGSGTPQDFQAMVYSAAGVLLYSSAVRADIGSAMANYTFTFAGESLSAGTEYIFAIGSNCDGTTATAAIQWLSGTEAYDGYSSTTETVNPASDTTFVIDGSRDFAIEVDYTPAGGAPTTLMGQVVM